MTTTKTRIAILGGGMGSLAAAWRLTDDPMHGTKYDITVYQADHLLGGKGASTRNLDAGKGQRIEEHGIHLLLGFYNVALHLLRRVYGELKNDPNIPPFDEVISAQDQVWMADLNRAGSWEPDPWEVRFPDDPDVVPGETGKVPSSGQLAAKAVSRLFDEVRRLFAGAGIAPPPQMRLRKFGTLAAVRAISSVPFLPGRARRAIAGISARAIDHLVRLVWLVAKPLLDDVGVRHAWIAVYLLGTNLVGVLRDDLLVRGTDHIDSLDYREWLRRHSAIPNLPPHLSNFSPPIRAFYDLAFSRVTGLAAGVSVIAIARMALGYEGHFAYRMNGGMGEVVFAPLHEALKQRGVRFCFGHRVERIEAVRDANGDLVIDEIQLTAAMAGKNADPTILVTGSDGATRRAWPTQPPPDSVKVTETLKRGAESDLGFDLVVLGISIEGLTPAMVGTLQHLSPRFDQMIQKRTCVATQAIQLWMTSSGNELGWPTAEPAMLISYERPFNSWVDMAHLVRREDWPRGVQSVQYLCDQLLPAEGDTEAQVKANAIDWINTHASRFWPRFQWTDLYDPNDGTGSARMDAQYFRANAHGSECYVTVGPGSVAARLAAGDSGFRNLALAGDWVRTQLSAGCLEAATTGGLEAGQAILDGKVKP